MTVDENASGRFGYLRDWQAMTDESASAIREFWQREGAIENPAEATRRLSEVVLHAVDESGAVTAVCTAYPALHPQLGQPLYHYRCFIGSRWRSSLLLRTMIRRATHVLEDYARTNAFPCVGVLVELENPRFREALNDAPVWRSQDICFFYIGKSPRNLDVRVHYFRDAHLKRN